MSDDPQRVVPDPNDIGGDLVEADARTIQREAVMILAAFKRFSSEQIAAVLQMPPGEVKGIVAHEGNKEQIETLSDLLPAEGRLQELLLADGERNILFMRGLRDGVVDEQRLDLSPQMVRIRQRAAEVLLDRQVPKRVEVLLPAREGPPLTEAQRARIQALLSPKMLPAPTVTPAEAADPARGRSDETFEGEVE